MMTGGPLTGLSDWKCRRKHLHDKKPEADCKNDKPVGKMRARSPD